MVFMIRLAVMLLNAHFSGFLRAMEGEIGKHAIANSISGYVYARLKVCFRGEELSRLLHKGMQYFAWKA